MQAIFFSIQVMTFGIKEKEENVETLCSKAGAHNVRGEALEEIAHRPVAGRLPERWDVHRAPTRNSNFVATVINAWNFLYVSVVDRHHTQQQYLSVKICELLCLLRFFIL